jgi:hypothetical protein
MGHAVGVGRYRPFPAQPFKNSCPWIAMSVNSAEIRAITHDVHLLNHATVVSAVEPQCHARTPSSLKRIIAAMKKRWAANQRGSGGTGTGRRRESRRQEGGGEGGEEGYGPGGGTQEARTG